MRVAIAKPRRPIHSPAVAMRRGHELKLNPDLMRSLLLFVEEKASRPISNISMVKISGYSDDEVAYHVLMATEADLLKADIHETPDSDDEEVVHVEFDIQRLTFRGHEFLDTVRDGKIWKQVKAGAAKAGVASAKALFQFALAYSEAKVKALLAGDTAP